MAAPVGTDFSFEVLARSDLGVAAAFEELGVAGLLKGERFTHALLKTTAYELTPDLVWMVLHCRLLEALRATDPAAVLVGHALGGHCWGKAYRLLTRASWEARVLLTLEDAEGFAGQAQAPLTEYGGLLAAALPTGKMDVRQESLLCSLPAIYLSLPCGTWEPLSDDLHSQLVSESPCS